jgi:hypothetical protein
MGYTSRVPDVCPPPHVVTAGGDPDPSPGRGRKSPRSWSEKTGRFHLLPCPQFNVPFPPILRVRIRATRGFTLCRAGAGACQVISSDILPMKAIKDVTFIQGDFTDDTVRGELSLLVRPATAHSAGHGGAAWNTPAFNRPRPASPIWERSVRGITLKSTQLRLGCPVPPPSLSSRSGDATMTGQTSCSQTWRPTSAATSACRPLTPRALASIATPAAPSRGPCSDAKSPRTGPRAPRLGLALSAPATGCWTRSGRSGL